MRAAGIIDKTHYNQSLVDLFPDIVGNALQRYNKDLQPNTDPFGCVDD